MDRAVEYLKGKENKRFSVRLYAERTPLPCLGPNLGLLTACMLSNSVEHHLLALVGAEDTDAGVADLSAVGAAGEAEFTSTDNVGGAGGFDSSGDAETGAVAGGISFCIGEFGADDGD